MELRALQLPEDFTPLADMICDAFQYPENPHWSVQTDEKEEIGHAVRSLKRMWPLFRLLQAVSPSLRDLFRGYVAIEDGKIVGVTIIQRRGTTDAWIVGTVGVLPAYRRRGLARACLERSLEMMKDHGATRTWLGVINGNTPAQELYESLGFELYDGTLDYTLTDPVPQPIPPLPEGYTISRLSSSDWRTRFELEKRIAPEETRRYEPIETGRFRRPLAIRLLHPIMKLVQREKEGDFVIRESGGEVIGRFGFTVSLRGKGVNNLRIHLDPKYPAVASHVFGILLDVVASLSPRLRIEIGIPRWMPAVVSAAEAFGFAKRVEYLKMGRAV